MAKQYTNSGDPDQMPRSAASSRDLHCLPITLLWVSRLQWAKYCDLALSRVCMPRLHAKELSIRSVSTLFATQTSD